MKNNILSIDKYRNNPEFYFAKGLRFANKRNLGEAHRNLTKALMLEPDNSEYKFNMACFLSELQRPGEANQLFRDILINFEPTMYECFFGLGCNSFEMGDNEKAAEYFDKYLYFDSEGEFNEEVSEMNFYLKLYSEIAHENKFLKTSSSSAKKAIKNLNVNELQKAIGNLYNAVIANPLNVEARNLLSLALLDAGMYIRAEYINAAVHDIDVKDIWGNCLNIFIFTAEKKKIKANRLLEILPFRQIHNREDLLCISTTLFLYGKFDLLIKLLEMYIVDFSDRLIYSILLLAYLLKGETDIADKTKDIIESFSINNDEHDKWVKSIENSKEGLKQHADEFYQKLFEINSKKVDFKYHPSIYRRILKNIKAKKSKLPNKYSLIIEGTLKQREIMYSSLYEKEIILILSKYLNKCEKPAEAFRGCSEMYSAALESVYCNLFHYDISKEKLIAKYSISAELLEAATKKFNFIL